jgi:hypothetical protein
MVMPEQRPNHDKAVAENVDAVRAAWEELRKARPILEEAKRVEQVVANRRRRRDDPQ